MIRNFIFSNAYDIRTYTWHTDIVHRKYSSQWHQYSCLVNCKTLKCYTHSNYSDNFSINNLFNFLSGLNLICFPFFLNIAIDLSITLITPLFDVLWSTLIGLVKGIPKNWDSLPKSNFKVFLIVFSRIKQARRQTFSMSLNNNLTRINIEQTLKARRLSWHLMGKQLTWKMFKLNRFILILNNPVKERNQHISSSQLLSKQLTSKL